MRMSFGLIMKWSEIILSFYVDFSFVRAALVWAILDITSCFMPLSDRRGPRYLKAVTVAKRFLRSLYSLYFVLFGLLRFDCHPRFSGWWLRYCIRTSIPIYYLPIHECHLQSSGLCLSSSSIDSTLMNCQYIRHYSFQEDIEESGWQKTTLSDSGNSFEPIICSHWCQLHSWACYSPAK